MLKRASLLVLLLWLPAALSGQSLGEIAKKEKERRRKNQEKGAKVRVIQEGEVSVLETEDTEITDEESREDAAAPSEEIETDAGDRTRSPSTPSREREEAGWRSRASEARERLESAQEHYDLLSQLHLTPGEYYMDEDGRPLITSLEQLRGLIAEAKAELEQATRAMNQFKEEARRAGVPPGWVR